MHTLSTADHGCTPPRIVIPDPYNAADDLLGRNLVAGRGSKVAYIDDAGSYTYDQLAARASRCGNALLGTLGLARGDRVLMCVLDCIDFPAMFLGAIKAGVVPIAVNTLLTERDYEYMLSDSGARVAVVSQALLANFAALPGRVPTLERLVVAGGDDDDGLEALLAAQSEQLDAAPTSAKPVNENSMPWPIACKASPSSSVTRRSATRTATTPQRCSTMGSGWQPITSSVCPATRSSTKSGISTLVTGLVY